MIEQILDKNKSIAVVGNGGSLLHSGCGTLIDSFDCVIRMNNYVLNKKIFKDVGSKQDVWCMSFCNDILEREFERLICPLPLNIPFHVDMFRGTNKNLLNKLKDLTVFIPEYIFNDLKKYIQNPSLGVCLLYWLCVTGYKITSNNIFGFDFFSEKHAHHYFNDHTKCLHDGSIEQQFINNLLKQNKY